jgi:hypothetical protein
MRVGAAGRRAIAVGIAAVCITGVSVATGATPTPTAVTACTNAHHTLGLRVDGRCAKHFHKVSVGASPVPGLGTVYVKYGLVSAAAGDRHRPLAHDELPMATVNVPGGDYVVHWQGFLEGNTTHPGQPSTQDLTFTAQCQPRSTSGADVSVGLLDVVSAAMAPEDYDSEDGQSHFDFGHSMTGFWVIRVPSGGAQLSVLCSPPVVTDGTGQDSAPDSYLYGGQVEAVRIAAIHGSDLLQF